MTCAGCVHLSNEYNYLLDEHFKSCKHPKKTSSANRTGPCKYYDTGFKQETLEGLLDG